MKTRQLFKICMLLTAMVLVSSEIKGQESFDISNLPGTWTFDPEASFARMDPDIKNYLNKNPDIKAEFLLAYEGRTLTFFDNGTMVQAMANGMSLTANWRIESNILFMGMEPDSTTEHPIMDLKNNRLVIRVNGLGRAKPFLSEMYFIKN